REGETKASDVAEAALARLNQVEDQVNAFVTVTDDLAREMAEDVDGALAGVPIALKDLRAMKKGTRHTFGVKPLEGFVAPRTAAFVERLEDEGAVFVGKSNVPEFGHKGVTNNELVGSTASPFDVEANAGGSSGGSAAAVAAGVVPLATGSDAGGSIRIPASLSGVYGLKTSYGLVPDDVRPNAFGRETHHVALGPIARSVEDAALMLDVTAGPHPRDPASLPDRDVRYRDAVDEDVDGWRVAYSRDLDLLPVEPGVEQEVEEAAYALEDAGAEVEEVEVDHGLSIDEFVEPMWTTFTSGLRAVVESVRREYGVDLRDYRDEVSDSLWTMVDDAEGTTAVDYALTGVARTRVFDAVQDVFDDHDVLVTPALGVSRVPREEDGVSVVDGEEVNEFGGWSFTPPFNWTGHPAASAPAGLDDGNPVGLQVVGPMHGDYEVLAASAALERVRPWDHIYDEVEV
ncbi:MAG: amidase, partial [Halobacteriales archaeon]